MGHELSAGRVLEYLAIVGARVRAPASLVILGGSGLALLGNPRPTLDIDFDGEEAAADEFRTLLEEVAAEMKIELEAVPLYRFIPLPAGSQDRHIPIGEFGKLHVMVFDPYSIALSKLDRGFDSDIEDIGFLLRRGLIDPGRLETMIDQAAISATEYDLNPLQMRAHLALARRAMSD